MPMYDSTDREIKAGQKALHFYSQAGRAHGMMVRITGFTPQRVRFKPVVQEEDEPHMTSMPEQFFILREDEPVAEED